MKLPRRPRSAAAALAGVLLLLLAGCVGPTPPQNDNGTQQPDDDEPAAPTAPRRVSDDRRVYPLDSLPTTSVQIGEHTFRAWLARDGDRQRPGIIQEGLMYVPTEEIEDDQGMLFVFSNERVLGFWMRNTIAPLDIAFARANGRIVKIWQMPPLTLQNFSSVEPALFALEVKQGTFERLGIREGDTLTVPQEARAAR
ncbi:MAG: DUF192 domain-containing protein [Phycisphaerales bacterium]|nr:DUF192 domain-containing protein [Phycisphaerales bacterium]